MPPPSPPAALSAEDLGQLRDAKALLEQPGLVARLSHYVGQPLELFIEKLPAGSGDVITKATEQALRSALKLALSTMQKGRPPPSNRLHQISAAASGVAGGAFGLPALAIELPVSTTIMLRSIADIARSHGEDLADPATQLACLETFALGGRAAGDDATDSGYFAARALLARSVSEAATYLATHATVTESAPMLLRLVSQIAARFSVPVTGKVAAQTVPIVGGIGGGIVNTMFISHYQDMATGHFAVRQLERAHGAARVRAAYDAIELSEDRPAR